MSLEAPWEKRLHKAVRHFWATRQNQAKLQGAKTGSRDAGERTAVTGGKQLDGFVALVRDYLIECGVAKSEIHSNLVAELPGWYRAEKRWDLLVIVNGNLVIAMEFKSQVGSFGNNFNNRAEESLGSATDIWTAYREGAFPITQRPWLGYVMILEDADGSTTPVAVKEPHFPVFPEFKDASYAKRYEILLSKLIRERLYDGAALLMTSRSSGPKGDYSEPGPDLGRANLLASIKARILAVREPKS
jgi:hypothetical protein